MIEVSAPGKLYIAGEYAVVEPGHPAIIIAINQFITVTLEKSLEHGSIQSEQFANYPVYFKRENDELILDKRENPFHYILAAIDIVETYAKELNKPLGLYHLKIQSGLDNGKGTKYGLGSSGAVTVATVEALCQFYDLPYDNMILFKLAALAHLSIQNNGSCGDVAASVYGGWIAFSTFNQNWVKEQSHHATLQELLDIPWPHLSIEPIKPPKELKLLIGWTGTPASTASLIDEVQKSEQKTAYQTFLKESHQCVSKLIKAFKEKDMTKIKQHIEKNRELLHSLSDVTNVSIETPALASLINIAQSHQGVAKTSGAGGGDCGIALFNEESDIQHVLKDWQQQGITYLPFKVFDKGALYGS